MSVEKFCEEQCAKIAQLETEVKDLRSRMKTVEGTVTVIHELATSVAVMAEQIKTINTGIADVNAHLESVEKKVEQIEITPSKEYNGIKQRITYAIVDFVIAAVLAGIAWAIVQAMT